MVKFKMKVSDRNCLDDIKDCEIKIYPKNSILDCLKEIWVVVDCGDSYSHGCSEAFYTVLANGVKVMDASLDNAGGVNDYAQISSPPVTFINPHPEYPSDTTARYNRVLINGALLDLVAKASSDGIVNIEANCNSSLEGFSTLKQGVG